MVSHKLFMEDVKKPEQGRIFGIWLLTAAMFTISLAILDYYVRQNFVSQEVVNLISLVIGKLGLFAGGLIPSAMGLIKTMLGGLIYTGMAFVFFGTLYFIGVLTFVFKKMGDVIGREGKTLAAFTAATFFGFHLSMAVLIISVLAFLNIWVLGIWIWALLTVFVGAMGVALGIATSIRALKQHFKIEGVEAFIMWMVGVGITLLLFSVLVGTFLLQIAV
jgi:hypothetical protein